MVPMASMAREEHRGVLARRGKMVLTDATACTATATITVFVTTATAAATAKQLHCG